jgi:hypothetical protein
MKWLEKSDVVLILERQRALGNAFLRRSVDGALDCYVFRIEDAATFFSLVWHYHRHTKVLTPGTWVGGKVYSVGDVCDRFLGLGGAFSDYSCGNMSGVYTPDWFDNCVKVYEGFSWDAFGALVVQPLNNAERRDCPRGTFRLIDGSHRTLVLGVLLREKKIEFRPIECVLVIPG